MAIRERSPSKRPCIQSRYSSGAIPLLPLGFDICETFQESYMMFLFDFSSNIVSFCT